MGKHKKGKQKANALIKFFSDREHYLNFKRGNSFFRTPHYYRLCKDAGRGDKNESCIFYGNRELGDPMPSLWVNGRQFDLDQTESVLVYPADEQRDSWMQSWCVFGPHNKFELSWQRIINEFGRYFVIMPAGNVERYAELIQKHTGEPVRYGTMRYSNDKLKHSLACKDSSYGYQKEFRFYVGECDKGTNEDRTLLLPGLDSLLQEVGSVRISSPNGDVRYCAQGSGEVVVARASSPTA